MEYIRPLTPPSLLQRVRIFLMDLIVVWACVRRFLDDHFGNPNSPVPQALQFASDFVPFYAREPQTSLTTATGKDEGKKNTAAAQKTDATTTPDAATAPPSGGAPYQLRVLSLNVWGLPISPKTTIRAEELAKSFHLYDIIALQEGSHEREVRIMEARAREAGLKYSHQFTIGVGFPIWHGITAPGLVVFSRYPIIDMNFKRYCINGKMYQLHHSDYMLAKGVALVRVDVSAIAYPDAAPGECRPVVGVDVFITHLHANYTNWFYDWRKWLPLMEELEARLEKGESIEALKHLMPIPLLEHVHDEYLAHRVLQSYECAKFIAAFRRPDFLTLLCGDLNSPAYDLCLQVIQSITFGQEDASCIPRFTDAFHSLHPHSHGFTCGAEDNTFTFSQQPLRMEMRAVGGGGKGEQTGEEAMRSATPPKGRKGSDASASSSANTSSSSGAPKHPPSYASQLRKRETYNSSPHPALVPSDAAQRASRTRYGEHPSFLPSSQKIVSPSSSSGAGGKMLTGGGKGKGEAAAQQVSKPAKGSVDEAAESPLAWLDENLPKRIDYVLYAQPSRQMQCACAWKLLQLPFHSVTQAEQSSLTSTCTCPPLPAPHLTWRNTSACVVKQYMSESSSSAGGGEVTSISDHHGIAVVFELQVERKTQDGQVVTSTTPINSATSVLLFSKRSPQPGEQPASQDCVASGAGEKRLRLKLMPGETELYTLDDGESPLPSSPIASNRSRLSPAPSSSGSSSSSGVSPTRTPSPSHPDGTSYSGSSGYPNLSFSTPAVGSVPALPISTILLLCEGVMWFGLKDATDRRRAHMRRSLQSFVVFAIGSRSLWVWVLDRYFETVVANIVPEVLWNFPLPGGLLFFFQVLGFVIDWLHSSLPIFIVLLWLCTTFPAKEEQSCIREAIREMTQLRNYNVKHAERQRRKPTTQQRASSSGESM